jgi:hypothetical protein
MNTNITPWYEKLLAKIIGLISLETFNGVALLIALSILFKWEIANLNQFPFLVEFWHASIVTITITTNLVSHLTLYSSSSNDREFKVAKVAYTTSTAFSFFTTYIAALNVNMKYPPIINITLLVISVFIVFIRLSILYKTKSREYNSF